MRASDRLTVFALAVPSSVRGGNPVAHGVNGAHEDKRNAPLFLAIHSRHCSYGLRAVAPNAFPARWRNDSNSIGDDIAYPAWVPDGQSVTYWRNHATNRSMALYWVDVSSATPGTPVELNDTLSSNQRVNQYERLP